MQLHELVMYIHMLWPICYRFVLGTKYRHLLICWWCWEAKAMAPALENVIVGENVLQFKRCSKERPFIAR
jgi:hypothetical protein